MFPEHTFFVFQISYSKNIFCLPNTPISKSLKTVKNNLSILNNIGAQKKKNVGGKKRKTSNFII